MLLHVESGGGEVGAAVVMVVVNSAGIRMKTKQKDKQANREITLLLLPF